MRSSGQEGAGRILKMSLYAGSGIISQMILGHAPALSEYQRNGLAVSLC